MLTSVVNKNLEAETVNKVELSGHSTGPVPRENPREEKMVPWNLSFTAGIVAGYDKQATVFGLLLTIFGDGGRGQVLSTVDRQLSPVELDHSHRPA